MTTTVRTCDGCGRELGAFDAGYSVCLDCTTARHRAVLARGRCKCGRKRRELPKVHRVGSRTWRSCARCLGSTGQLS